MTDVKKQKAGNNSDLGQDIATFLGSAALIGGLVSDGNMPQEKSNFVGNNEKTTTSYTSKVARDTGAALVGGGVTAAALRKRRKNQENTGGERSV